jgi:2-polyprenyl-3-methyl-5-hydroxy-6-metoxy-1,4-benzoquinol methylase
VAFERLKKKMLGRGAVPSADEFQQGLRDELALSSTWMYEWELGGGIVTPVGYSELPDIQRTKLKLMEAPVRTALQDAGPTPTVLDLGCGEGWFSHRMLEWGASRVLGIDNHPKAIRRAELLRDHFRIPSRQIELRCADVFELSSAELGT